MGVKCFFIKPTGKVIFKLRRYNGDLKCSASGMGYHDASIPVEDKYDTDKDGIAGEPPIELKEKYKDSFPTQCVCGYKFTDADRKQYFQEHEYADGEGNLMTLRIAQPGAMWNADWYNKHPQYTGPDGLSLVVKLPNNYDWIIDSVASNCDSPCKHCNVPRKDHRINNEAGHFYEDKNPHKCWVRHGTPPMITVDKNGNTCGAGAGSIGAGEGVNYFHGYLRNGEIVV